MLTNQNFKAGQQIQVKTKTNRHQLHNVWLNILRVNDKKLTCQVPGEDSTWGIPKSMVIKVREGNGQEVVTPAGTALDQMTIETILEEINLARAEFIVAMNGLERKLRILNGTFAGF